MIRLHGHNIIITFFLGISFVKYMIYRIDQKPPT